MLKSKVFLWVVSCLLITVLLLTSCAKTPSAPTTATTTTTTAATTAITTSTTKPTTATTAATSVKPSSTTTTASDKPQYGGDFRVVLNADILSFDPGASPMAGGPTFCTTNEPLVAADWARGPAGTNEITLMLGGFHGVQYEKGQLAESWEVPDMSTFIFHIRKGVRWALNPSSEASKLVNGRELTADDVVFSYKRYGTLPSHIRTFQPVLATATFEAKDKYTVVSKLPKDGIWIGVVMFYYGTIMAAIEPPEVIQKYGNMQDWRNSVGTGPFMLTDFVPGSGSALIKNPDYWDKDPVGPGKGNKLPYLDSLHFMIIPDVSTQLSAIRTGKADWLTFITRDDAQGLIKNTPDLKYQKYMYDRGLVLGMRIDKKELPFKDIKVRQALMMATNFNSLKNDLYGGDAEILVWPVKPTKGFENAFMPLEQLPANVKDLYSYKPDKAKQLLTEAGYPNGFKTKVLCQNTDVDILSAIKDMWAKVGVTLQLDPREFGAYSAIKNARSYEEMEVRDALGIAAYAHMANYRGVAGYNVSFVNDPKVEELYTQIQQTIMIDPAKADKMHRDFMPYLLEQAYVIGLTQPYNYTFWWPWLKNYRGELNVWYDQSLGWFQYVWIDQALKEKMTGKK